MQNLLKIGFLGLVFLLFYQPAQGQFLEKLKKRVEKKAEDVVLDKSADKTGDEVGKGMDGIFNSTRKKKKRSKSSSVKKAPKSTYSFDYRYTMQMKTQDHEMNMVYFLTKKGDYMGIETGPASVGMFLITDGDKDMQYTFMNAGGRKMMQSSSLDLSQTEAEDATGDYTYTNLPNKTFLGYNCQGKRFENEDYSIDFYYTTDAPVSMVGFGQDKNTNFPEELAMAENALVMYMKMKHKRKSKRNMEMRCVDLTKTDYDFSTGGYQQF